MPVLGIDAKLYRNTNTWASPTWDLITNVRDVTLNLEKNQWDATTRGGNGWRQRLSVLKDGSVEFEMIWDPGDADFEAFRDAWLNNTLIDCWVLDGLSSTSGNQGLRAEFDVNNFTRNEPLEEGLTVTINMTPGYSDNAPEWKEVP